MSQPSPPAAPFTVRVEPGPDATVVHCDGRLVGEASTTLRTEGKKLMEPNKRIVLDLTGVTTTDSLGLGAITSLYISAKSIGARLELINLGQKIRQVFSMANLLSLFEPAVDNTS